VPLGRHAALELPDALVISLGVDALVVQEEATAGLPDGA